MAHGGRGMNRAGETKSPDLGGNWGSGVPLSVSDVHSPDTPSHFCVENPLWWPASPGANIQICRISTGSTHNIDKTPTRNALGRRGEGEGGCRVFCEHSGPYYWSILWSGGGGGGIPTDNCFFCSPLIFHGTNW